ncbi:tetratricopeptide repeat protein [Lysobacter sp.]|uniref:tetratricopeptide repeat protein n=1 Tax=Lysobacter sp. TaxID=72226 RepID=UPI002D6FD4B7|nr:tetratricopeptide repeat protein [Lysobacter sp.]HZX76204.1 tetratricopeptide repeat protein [Lysobacter sp.]
MRRPYRTGNGFRVVQARCAACAVLLASMSLLHAQEDTLGAAEAMVKNRQYGQAYELLAPMGSSRADDARFLYLLGRAALGAGDAERARVALERSIELDPDSAATHLALGRAYHALGQHANARNQFEIAIHFEDLPPDLLTQVDIYEEAAREALEEGRRTTMFGYAATGIGRYRVNSTRGTNAFGGGDRRETFYNLRVGGGLNHALSDRSSIDATLDYRHREYDEGSRDDRDLRWSLAANRTLDDANVAGGLRGRVSYRGDGDYRNDIAGFVEYNRNVSLQSQLNLGLSVQRRRYPDGPLRARSRTTSLATVGWSQSFANGAGSFGFTAHGGRNTATSRPDGESDVYGATANLDWTFGDTLDAFVYVWWERDAYNTDRVHFHPDALDEGVILRRKDNLYEGGVGLVWEFAPGWSLRPELLYIRDQSNVVGFNYSSTEAWINVRKGF